MSKPDPRERRKHLRFPVDECALTIQRAGLMSSLGLKKENLARALLDLSEGGLCARIAERLPSGTRLRVHIQLPKYSDEIEALGESRWCAQDPKHSGEFTVGVMFVKLDTTHGRKIANMKNWFTSPQFRHKHQVKEREKKKGLLDFFE